MKYLFMLMAEYNKQANEKMFEILRSIDPHIITDKAGSYFDNILGLLNHSLLADMGWLSAYRDSDISIPSLESPVLDFENPGWKNNLFENMDKLWEVRSQVDDLFIRFTRGIEQEALEGPITLERGSKKIRFILHEVLMHLFNHQTHHRGGIAVILDQAGVENDFSNLLDVLHVENI